jgi:hypothetical protein
MGKVVRCIRFGVQSDDNETQYSNQGELEQRVLKMAERFLELG